MRNVSEWIEFGYKKWADKVAVETKKTKITYKQLKIEMDKFSGACISSGIKQQERVAIYCPNIKEAVFSILGTFKMGGIVVCIHPDTPENKVERILKDSKASLLISYKHIKFSINHSIKKVFVDTNSNERNDGEWELYSEWTSSSLTTGNPLSDNAEARIAALIYTSGSTYDPKGIICTHKNIIFSTNAINRELKYTVNDKVLSYLPLSFDYGLYQLFLSFSVGATLYLRESHLFGLDIQNTIKREDITILPGMRSIFNLFLNNKKADMKFPSVRIITNTGDSIVSSSLPKLEKVFPNSLIYLMYGLSECKRVSILDPCDLILKPNSVGKPLNGTKATVMNRSMKECAPFEIGELVIQGPHVCEGYWQDPNMTKRVFIKNNGVRSLKSGDLFYRDNEGYLYFVGRKDHLLKSKGYRINPREIENVLYEGFQQEIDESFVVGIEDQLHGVKICAYIVSSNPFPEKLIKRIKDYCRIKMEPWKQPEIIKIFPSIPITRNGKIDQKKIKKLLIDSELENPHRMK